MSPSLLRRPCWLFGSRCCRVDLASALSCLGEPNICLARPDKIRHLPGQLGNSDYQTTNKVVSQGRGTSTSESLSKRLGPTGTPCPLIPFVPLCSSGTPAGHPTTSAPRGLDWMAGQFTPPAQSRAQPPSLSTHAILSRAVQHVWARHRRTHLA